MAIFGSVDATGVSFTGVWTDLDVNNGGELNLIDCALTGSQASVTYAAGSSGTVANCSGDSWTLIISDSDVAVTGGIEVGYLALSAPISVIEVNKDQ